MMDLPAIFLIYATLFRLAVIGAGVLIIVLGYRLFAQGIAASASSETAASGGGFSLTLKNAAPGTSYALFGAILISVSVIKGSPELIMGRPELLMPPTGAGMPAPREIFADVMPGQLILRGDDRESGDDVSLDDQQGDNSHVLINADIAKKLLQVGLELERSGEGQLALEAYRMILALPGRSAASGAAAMNQIAWLYLTRGDAQIALPVAQMAYQQESDNPVIIDTLAEAYLHNGELVEAEKVARQGLELSPNDSALTATLQKIIDQKSEP